MLLPADGSIHPSRKERRACCRSGIEPEKRPPAGVIMHFSAWYPGARAPNSLNYLPSAEAGGQGLDCEEARILTGAAAERFVDDFVALKRPVRQGNSDVI